ncbi:MAG: DnaJ domain [Betaproteobacteria bacterium]|nr:DnaJ domain [Betaproteobacteria bacterium]
MKTLYQQLGVTPHASQTAIQQSYFRLKRKLHSNTPPQKNECPSAEYLAVQNAYRTLSNSELRAEYDQTLQLQLLNSKSKKERP